MRYFEETLPPAEEPPFEFQLLGIEIKLHSDGHAIEATGEFKSNGASYILTTATRQDPELDIFKIATPGRPKDGLILVRPKEPKGGSWQPITFKTSDPKLGEIFSTEGDEDAGPAFERWVGVIGSGEKLLKESETIREALSQVQFENFNPSTL